MVICDQPVAAAIGVLKELVSALNEQVGTICGTDECTDETDECDSGTDECADGTDECADGTDGCACAISVDG